MKETHWFQRLREEVSIVIRCGYKWYHKAPFLYKLAYKVMTSVYVLGARVIFWIIGRVNRGLIIQCKLHGLGGFLESKLVI